jgi:predicted nucleic acid-binding protein
VIVVSNTTPLIGLAVVGQFDLLRQLFGRIIIPEAVFAEAVLFGREQGGAKQEVTNADWIEVAAVSDRLAVDVLLDELDRGEAETIVLARELHADWVLMDEKKGRRKLVELKQNKVGTVGILLKGKQAGLLAEIGPYLEILRHQGFSLSRRVVESALKQANEI